MPYTSTQPSLSRRSLLAAGLGSLLAGTVAGCAGAPKPRLAIALMDVTGSVVAADWGLYQTSGASLVNSLHPGDTDGDGDRLLVATISSASISRFVPTFAGTLIDDGTPDSDKNIQAARDGMLKAIEQTRPVVPQQQTRLFETLAACQEMIKTEPARTAECLICSDMIESSDYGEFDQAPPSTGRAGADLIGRLRSAALLPDFGKANIYVCGAGGRDGRTYELLGQFWRDYFRAANATLVSYGRAAANFPADPSTQN